MLNPEFKAKWLTALRSGKYQQCRRILARPEANGQNYSYCCIGVAGVVAGYEVNGSHDSIRRPDGSRGPEGGYSAMNDFGMTQEMRSTLVSKNDTDGESFEQIADYIEGNL